MNNHPFCKTLGMAYCHTCGKLKEDPIHRDPLSNPEESCKPAKHDIQQLKSVRDDLANRFKENDKLYQLQLALLPNRIARNTCTRIKRKLDKLSKQIVACNNLIKFLEKLLSNS